MLSRELKLGIIAGVVSAVLVIIFIQPLLGLVWSVILSFGETIQAGYVDRIYSYAAFGETHLAGQLCLFGISLFIIVAPPYLYLADLAKRNIEARNPFRVLHISITVVSLFMTPLFVIAMSLSMGVSKINASFSQRLTVLAPEIDEQELKQWKARWAKMQGRKDYIKLVDTMEKRSAEKNIALPKIREP